MNSHDYWFPSQVTIQKLTPSHSFDIFRTVIQRTVERCHKSSTINSPKHKCISDRSRKASCTNYPSNFNKNWVIIAARIGQPPKRSLLAHIFTRQYAHLASRDSAPKLTHRANWRNQQNCNIVSPLKKQTRQWKHVSYGHKLAAKNNSATERKITNSHRTQPRAADERRRRRKNKREKK